jgi:hypothetical protein
MSDFSGQTLLVVAGWGRPKIEMQGYINSYPMEGLAEDDVSTFLTKRLKINIDLKTINRINTITRTTYPKPDSSMRSNPLQLTLLSDLVTRTARENHSSGTSENDLFEVLEFIENRGFARVGERWVQQLLNRIPESKESLLEASITPRYISMDILSALLEPKDQTNNNQNHELELAPSKSKSRWNWIKSNVSLDKLHRLVNRTNTIQPQTTTIDQNTEQAMHYILDELETFCYESGNIPGVYQYHEEVRHSFISYMLERQPRRFRELNKSAANYYESCFRRFGLEAPRGRECLIEAFYHWLRADEEKATLLLKELISDLKVVLGKTEMLENL